MKRRNCLLITSLLLLVMSACMFVGCKKGHGKAEIVSKTETMVVIKVKETEGFVTLLDAMNYLKEEGELFFEISVGMVSSIEGKANPADLSSCWMLYTSDAEMSNSEWGTVEVNGSVYGSAILGAESLQVNSGEYYVWSYVTF